MYILKISKGKIIIFLFIVLVSFHFIYQYVNIKSSQEKGMDIVYYEIYKNIPMHIKSEIFSFWVFNPYDSMISSSEMIVFDYFMPCIIFVFGIESLNFYLKTHVIINRWERTN